MRHGNRHPVTQANDYESEGGRDRHYFLAANSSSALMRALSCTPGTLASPLIHAASTLLSIPIRAAKSSGPSKALALAINLCAVSRDTQSIY